MSRLDDLRQLYAIFGGLDQRLGGARNLSANDSLAGLPQRGLYFFFEPGELDRKAAMACALSGSEPMDSQQDLSRRSANGLPSIEDGRPPAETTADRSSGFYSARRYWSVTPLGPASLGE